MLEFASNTDITIDVPYEYNGTALTLTGFEYEVLDADSNTTLVRQADPNFSAVNSFSTLSLPASANTTTKKRDVRLLNAYLITANGTYVVPQVYLLKGNQLELTVLTDSYMTYAQAVLTRASMAEELPYYDALTEELKAVALEEAFNRINRLQFTVGTDVNGDPIVYNELTTLTVPTFIALDSNFLSDLRKAQITEANSIVQNSPVKDKIRAGIISETIGESSMFFKQSGIPLTPTGLADDTEEYLKRWLYKEITSSMTWKLARG